MIKKTFNTIIKHPFIFVIYVLMVGIASASFYTLIFVIHKYRGSALSINLYLTLSKILTAIFYSVVIYFIYLASTDSISKGWIFVGLKRWWRYLLVGIVFAILYSILTNILSFLFVSNADAIINEFTILSIINYAVGYILGGIYILAYIPVIVENKFADGIANIFKVCSKFSLKFYAVYFILNLFSLISVVYLSPTALALNSINRIIMDFVAAPAITLFLYLYGMRLYVNEKGKMEDSEDEVSGEEEQAS
ncbi:MAG: hypothetical protein JXN65_09980 [Clostridia bacterium]|nr:hypothetical protein [Clostridia bacterium]